MMNDFGMVKRSSLSKKKFAPAHKTLGIRFYVEEIEALDAAVEASGAKSRNYLVRRLARRAGGLVDPDPEVIEAWGELVIIMRSLGANLNQIAHRANQGRVIWPDHASEDVAELRKSVARMQRFLVGAHRGAKSGRISPTLFAALDAFSEAEAGKVEADEGDG